MGNACGALLDQPRPNPKDPAVNLCTMDTVSQEEASSEKDIPSGGLIEAANYCNLRGADPKLRYGFSQFDNLAPVSRMAKIQLQPILKSPPNCLK